MNSEKLQKVEQKNREIEEPVFCEIEKKWRKIWEDTNAYYVDPYSSEKPKYYVLDMFPYPSGSGLHVGHWRGYVISDVYARLKMMQGYNVLHPMGWDSFGLPAENAAIKEGVHPEPLVRKNIDNFRRQLKEIGATYDWSKEFATSDPDYYKWTQWIFLKLYKAGLAYRKEMPINFCPSCGTGLANEEVVNGACERCGTNVERRLMKQWMMKITAYADRLIDDLDKIDWPENVKALQRNWIGRSYGASVYFPLEKEVIVETADERGKGCEKKVVRHIEIFTTRPDTLFGATYMVLAPEHPLVDKITPAEYRAAVEAYVRQAINKSDLERQAETREKTGVFTGAYALNPMTGEKIPIWIGDYVLAHYGTGAIMCVPAHDQRDFEFAKKFNLPVKEVILEDGKTPSKDPASEWEAAFTGVGTMINSGQFNGLRSDAGIEKVIAYLEKEKLGKKTVNYKLRDWIFARQRYWGEPIPIIYCDKCGEVPVPEEQLPVLLPYVEKYKPTGTGQSPLAAIESFVNTECPECGGPAKRETDTMPQWAGSCWYFLRYPNPRLKDKPFDPELMKKWLPVDLYVGGVEHATLHLLYSRFFVKALYDLGYLPFDEPFKRLFNQGIVYRNGARMSKSRGNVVNPDEIVAAYGADSLRMFELFMGPPDLFCEWKDDGIEGIYRFLKRTWKAVLEAGETEKESITKLRHRTIKLATERMNSFQFNTFIALIMEFINAVYREGGMNRDSARALVIMLSPMAPHIMEELWQRLGEKESVLKATWPSYDPELARVEEIEIPVQVNGRVRETLRVPPLTPEEEIQKLVMSLPKIQNMVGEKKIKKFIYVQDRIVNIVI